jgi:hypothetical protein
MKKIQNTLLTVGLVLGLSCDNLLEVHKDPYVPPPPKAVYEIVGEGQTAFTSSGTWQAPVGYDKVQITLHLIAGAEAEGAGRLPCYEPQRQRRRGRRSRGIPEFGSL